MGGAQVLLAVGLGLTLAGCGESKHESIASGVTAQIPRWAKEQGFAGNREALAGAKLFAESGCTNCHTYLGAGSTNLGAPDLSAEGARGKRVEAQVDFLTCPSCGGRGGVMPPFKALGPENLHRIAVFLEASKGKQ